MDLGALERAVEAHTRGAGVVGDAEWLDEPMPLDRWLTAREMFGTYTLSEKQLEIAKHAERVLYEPTFDELGWEKVRSVFDLNLALGKGSGKNLTCRLIFGRALYLLLMLKSPQSYFGMPVTDSIHLLNLATSAPQARRAFFAPLSEMLGTSDWFADRIELKATEIQLERNITVISGHSKIESQEGLNPLLVVLDEIAGFRTVKELERQKRLQDREPENSATGIHRLASSSVRSRFPETGKVISISFTRFKHDAIDSLVRESEREYELLGEASRKYSMRAATWEVNPLRKREDFEDDYRRDPVDARCRYECKPAAAQNRFFANLVAVKQAMNAPSLTVDAENEIAIPTVGIEYYYGKGDDPTLMDAWQVSFDLSALEHHEHPLAFHMDLGIKHDLAGLAASHVDGWVDLIEEVITETGAIEEHTTRVPKVVTDFVIAFEPQQGNEPAGIPPSDIQVRWIRSLVLRLMAEGWKVGLFTADGYQSTDNFQILEQHGIETELYSLDRKPEGYQILKSLIADQRVTAPWCPELYA